MQSESWGIFAHRKWQTELSVSFPSPSGTTLRSFLWPGAIIDTGSPTHIIPGRAATYTDETHARYQQFVDVTLHTVTRAEPISLVLPHNGFFPIPIGGVESLPVFRFEFWGHLYCPAIPALGDSPFIIMDVPAPIISVGQCLEEAREFRFTRHGFSVR